VTAGGGWLVEVLTGSAADFHEREPAADAPRSAWWFEVDRPAMVLGSAQDERHVDLDACRTARCDVTRRRSGGGAVLMLPGEIVWLDVVVPRTDPLWDADIGRAMWWFGEAWATALRSLGVADVEVHRGPMHTTAWSRAVCFDGVGAGEVLVGGAKAVGISQRRTRHWARLQSAVHLVWRPAEVVRLLAAPRPAADELGPVWSSSAAVTEVRSAVMAALASLDGQTVDQE
jgi:lipoate---protein ligase